ncbi:hypothetical protein CTheo_81 [Ceratobasidium theobromae]|uniref:Uncharacterized protein n=1 Tax=Ceratobasidium theobromae TaxID=1582974 RepID=A0A5N5QXL5_9AGAM|nr:hypothetical protein CTheo_81 [Ceratobasidium theobromae]
MADNKFEKTPLNTVRRRPDRGVYDKETVASIVREARVMHVAFVGARIANPKDFQLELNTPAGFFQIPKDCPSAFRCSERGTRTKPDNVICTFTRFGRCRNADRRDCNDRRWASPRALCILAFDELPLVRDQPMCLRSFLIAYTQSAPTIHGGMIHSAVVHGVILPVPSDEEKSDAFRLLVEQLAPGRWDNSRQPNEEELQGTGVLRVKVETASAKIRTGPPKDDKKASAQPRDLVSNTWTGVIPFRVVPGEPEPSSYCTISAPPAHVSALASAPSSSA